MLQKNRYKIKLHIWQKILNGVSMTKTVLLLTVYYEGGLFLVMCHHAMYKHFHTHKYDCCTGTVNISSWCVCVSVGGEGGFSTHALTGNQWLFPRHLQQKMHGRATQMSCPPCEYVIAPLLTLKPPYTSTTLVVSDRQTVILYLQTIYVYTEWCKGLGEVVVPYISHGKVMYP